MICPATAFSSSLMTLDAAVLIFSYRCKSVFLVFLFAKLQGLFSSQSGLAGCSFLFGWVLSRLLSCIICVRIGFLFVTTFLINLPQKTLLFQMYLVDICIYYHFKRMRGRRQTAAFVQFLIFLGCFSVCLFFIITVQFFKPAADVKALPRLSHSQFCYTFVHHFKKM